MALTDFTIIRRSMTARMFSTVITVVTVGVAVGLMLVLLSMRDAGQKAFRRGTGNMHLLVSADQSPLVSVLNAVFYANAPPRPIPWARAQEVMSDPRLAWAVPIQQGDSYAGYPVVATLPEYFRRFSADPGFRSGGERAAWALADGALLEGPFEVVLGARAAKETGLRVGDEVHLTHGIRSSRQPGAGDPHVHREFDYRVVGVLEPTGTAHDRALFTHLEGAWIIHAHDFRRQADPSVTTTTIADVTDADRKITGLYLRGVTREGSDTSPIIPAVASELRRDLSITVAEPKKEVDRLFVIVGSINELLVAMAAVVMVSSGIGIMLALYNSMEQRRRQVAVLRVLGCSRGRVFGLVLTESAVLGVLGGLLGVLLHVAGGLAVAAALKERLGLVVEPALSPEWTLAIVLGAVVLATLAGVIPAVMAYRTGVAKNLRPVA